MGCDSAVGSAVRGPARHPGLETLAMYPKLGRCWVLGLSAVSFSAPHDSGGLMWFVLLVQPTSKYSLS